ncbi:MAG: site-specific integrase [Rhizobiaceae bacterium]|nr:site-specific integrase [Rhizobiaceae bacterium]MCV0408884.1 site-specific integrase [Rhizobiaceae bacterium]
MVTRHGKTRWRYRKSGQKDVMLPGEPHTDEFDDAYQRAILGQPAAVIRHPSAAHPKSLKAAYRILRATPEWKALDARSRTRYQQTIERVLTIKLGPAMLGDGPVEHLRRGDVKAILAKFADTPHMERIVLICLRKLIVVALDEEWIDVDPTYKLARNPQTDGHKAWPIDVMARYEAKWKIGTRQRTAYALALWLGNRVSDVARLRWSHLVTKHVMIDGKPRSVEGFEFVQFKGRKRGKTMFLPMTPMLAREIAPLSRDTDTVLVSRYGRGYTDQSLSQRMSEWCAEAGIEAGYTMHGLRKALGVKLAEADASTRQLMEMLGHSNITYAELYSREASQMRLAVQAMEKVTEIEEARSRPALTVVK